MERRVGSPAKYRFEDRALFVVVPLFFFVMAMDVVLGFLESHYHHFHPSGVLALVCAAVQSLPIVASIVIAGLYLAEETDDFQKTVLVQSLLWGIGVTLAVATFCGSLEKYGQVQRMNLWSIQLVFFAVAVVSTLVARWRYR